MTELRLTNFEPWPYGVVPLNPRGTMRKGYVVTDDGCWLYLGFIDRDGYGMVTLHRNGRTTSQMATRFHWERWCPDRLLKSSHQLDHRCRNRACINPKHLRRVSHARNIALAAPYRIRKARCIRGHRFSKRNVYISHGLRSCKTCNLARVYLRCRPDATLDEAIRIKERELKTQPMTPDRARRIASILKRMYELSIIPESEYDRKRHRLTVRLAVDTAPPLSDAIVSDLRQLLGTAA